MAWYEEYFTKDWMKFRDVEAMLEKAPSEVDFLESALQISPPAAVLDVGCGFGRHAIELAARGYVVTGLDLSAELLARASEMTSERAVSVTWLEKDMRQMEFDAEFDAVICLYTSFGYFETEEENLEVLRRMSKALREGGRLALDVENRDGLLMRYLSRDWWQTKAGDLVMEERRFDPVKGRGRTKIVLVSGGHKIEHNLSIRWYSVPELERMAKEVGIQVQRLCGGLDGSEFDLGAYRLVVVGEKI
ncbi:MAG: class I SAM-dependent methyltransferase [Chloroflexota bacterium]